jgi:hypothetical protein
MGVYFLKLSKISWATSLHPSQKAIAQAREIAEMKPTIKVLMIN